MIDWLRRRYDVCIIALIAYLQVLGRSEAVAAPRPETRASQ